jgi:hypothetical protein
MRELLGTLINTCPRRVEDVHVEEREHGEPHVLVEIHEGEHGEPHVAGVEAAKAELPGRDLLEAGEVGIINERVWKDRG